MLECDAAPTTRSIKVNVRLIAATNRDIEQTGGNVTEAARLLGVQANYLRRLISNLNSMTALKK